VERAAIRIYWYASVLAVVEAFLLFILGLDLRVEQVKTLFIFGFPAPIIDDTAARLGPAFVLVHGLCSPCVAKHSPSGLSKSGPQNPPNVSSSDVR